VLQVLEEDLVVRREGRCRELLRVDELFRRLAENFRKPKSSAQQKFKWTGDREEFR
jgi:hypothetical protein